MSLFLFFDTIHFMKKIAFWFLFAATVLSFLTPFWVSRDLLFPFITSKAFYLRILVELGLPFFLYLILADPTLRPSYKNPLHISVVLFLLFNLVSAFAGIDPHKAIWGNFERMGGVFYIAHLVLLYFYVVVLSKAGDKWLKYLCLANVVIASLLSVYGILEVLGMPPWVPDPSLPGRVSATLGNPIFLPSYLIPILFLTLFWGFRKKAFVRAAYFFAAGLQLIAIYLSATRGATLGLLAGGVIAGLAILYLAPRGRMKTWGSVAAALALWIFILLYANSSRLPQGSFARRIFELKDSNTQARLIQWQTALKGFRDYPLFGVGPENYYVLANKYFNPDIYNYDPSWFDKPHNYLLEVLTTGGVFGFAAYLAILFFCARAFFLVFRRGGVSLKEFWALLAGLLVYQVQNLFVFDTVSASMSFFIFLGVGGFLQEKLLLSQPAAKTVALPPGSFAQAIFALTAIFTAWAVYALNVLPLQAAKNVNYGYAYGVSDPTKAQNYFQAAVNQSFNFDQGETASKYQEFAGNLLNQAAGKTSTTTVDNISQSAILALQNVLNKNPHNPIYWEELGNLYMTRAYVLRLPLDPGAEDALNTAMDLAPRRTEAMSAIIQLYMMQNRGSDAVNLGRRMLELNPKNQSNRWEMAAVFAQTGHEQEALSLAEGLIAEGYQFPNTGLFSWMLASYQKQKAWDKAIVVYQAAIKQDQNNADWYIGLVQAYFLNGDLAKAQNLAEKLVQADASLAEKLKPFLPASQGAPVQ